MAKRVEQEGDWKKKLPEVINRVRSSIVIVECEESAVGVADGRRWALNDAGFREFRSIDGAMRYPDILEVAIAEHGPDTVWRNLDLPDPDQSVFISEAYLKGFLSGALEVWKEVRDQL